MKHSIVQEIAEREGVSIRTVQRLLRKASPDRPRTWHKSETVDAEAVSRALERGRRRCPNQPCRYAVGEGPVQLE